MSSPGRVRVLSENSRSVIAASLYNFDTGSASLKPEHLQWLDGEFFRKARQHRYGHLKLHGRASRRHTDIFNRRLSEARADAVLTRMAHNLGGRVVITNEIRYTGEDYTIGAAEDDELDRAVEVRYRPIHTGYAPEPIQAFPMRLPIDPAPATRNENRRFRIRLIAGQNFGIPGFASLSGEDWIVLIADSTEGAFYRLSRGSQTVRWIMPQGATFLGPWNELLTPHSQSVVQFGPAFAYTLRNPLQVSLTVQAFGGWASIPYFQLGSSAAPGSSSGGTLSLITPPIPLRSLSFLR